MSITRRRLLYGAAVTSAGLLGMAGPAHADAAQEGLRPSRGPGRPRLLVCTDIGGTDPDDFQSMVHLLVAADRFHLEGIVSSPFGAGRKADILRVIDLYDRDFGNLRTWSPHYPRPEALRSLSKQGALESAGPGGVGTSTEGSQWIIRCARRRDPRPLNVLVWGGIDDLAQALHDAPDILPNLRVYFIGGPNKLWSVNAYDYIETHHPDLWVIESNSTYRGFFTGGDQTGEWSNTTFVEKHVDGHGALGSFFAGLLSGVKMGDTPSVTWHLNGDGNPGHPGWGGQYVPVWDGRKTIFDRLTTTADVVEAYGVVEWLISKPVGYGESDTTRFVVDNRLGGPFPTGVDEGDALRFRYSPRDARPMSIVVQSTHPDLEGLTGGFTAAPPPEERWKCPSTTHRNWWCDDQGPAAAEGVWPGAKTVSRWRLDYLADFASRMDRCAAPRRPRGSPHDD